MNVKDKLYIFCHIHKSIMLRIAWPNVIFYFTVVPKVISIYKLIHHNTGHPAYVITYPEIDMTFPTLSAST